MKNLLKRLAIIASGNFRTKWNSVKLLPVAASVMISSMGMAQSKSTATASANITASENKLRDFYRSYIAAANARDYDAIANVVAENVKLNGKMVKRADIIAQFKILTEAIPDFKWDLQQLVVDGEAIGARLRDSGTPGTKTFFGDNPQKISVEFTEFGSYQVRDGLFVEMWFLIDVTAISQQLNK